MNSTIAVVAKLRWLLPCLLLQAAHAQLSNSITIRSFGGMDQGGEPHAGVIEASDGRLYGSTTRGNRFNAGFIFSIGRDGADHRVLHHFYPSQCSATPFGPEGELMESSDGAIYGTSIAEGTNCFGVVFKIEKSGDNFVVLHRFGFSVHDGEFPSSALAESADGVLYGTTTWGGDYGYGTLFSVNRDGSNYQVIHSFSAQDGAYPQSKLVVNEGLLFGVAGSGGIDDSGTIFHLRGNGSDFTLLHQFASTNDEGRGPSGVVLGSDGYLYGATTTGGANGVGTLFRTAKDGENYSILHHFAAERRGDGLCGPLLEGSDGFLYGTGDFSGVESDGSTHGDLFRIKKDGTDFAILHQFSGFLDGSSPIGVIVHSRDGKLYGVTRSQGREFLGTLYSLDPDGSHYNVLYGFREFSGEAGLSRRLLTASDGMLYGTARSGGTNGQGVVFRTNPDGTDYRIVHHFEVAEGGRVSSGNLCENINGKLLGLITGEAASKSDLIFEMNRDGSSFRIIHEFEESISSGELHCAKDGAIYGTTWLGGTNNGGAIFKMNSDGSNYRTMHNFGTLTDGSYPYGQLLLSSAGIIYGVTRYGGDSSMFGGTVYSLNTNGTDYRLLHSFGPQGDGEWPIGIIQSRGGLLYGTTRLGGTNSSGVLFRLGSDGSGYGILQHFDASEPHPSGSLWEGHDGALYGIGNRKSEESDIRLLRFNKADSGWAVLCSLRSGSESNAGPGDIVEGSDGALYCITARGGNVGGGSICRFGHAISLRVLPNQTVLGLAGIPGYTYELERSTDLVTWTTRYRFEMPQDFGLILNDFASPAIKAFWRLRAP